MTVPALRNSRNQAVLERFAAACAEDARVVAAFLSGSEARGEADDHSDLDIDVVTTDAAYQEFCETRVEFVRRLGNALLHETFNTPDYIFFAYADGADGELAIGREGDLTRVHSGPYRVLVDKKGILPGEAIPLTKPDTDEQLAKVRAVLDGFWHDYSHLLTALARKQDWWAQGQLE